MKIKIGISEQEKICQEILDLIDCIEVKNINPQSLAYFKRFNKKILFHCQNIFNREFSFINDDDFIAIQTAKKTKELINSLKPTFLSFHLGLAVTKYRIDGYDILNEGPILSKKEILKRTKANIQIIKDTYPYVSIYLENNPYLLEYSSSKEAFKYLCEPEFITQMIEETKCYFLLDIPHAVISSYNLGFQSPENYLSLLPLEKTKEIHFHKPIKKGFLWSDAHLPINKEDIKLLKFVLKKAKNVKYLVVESQGRHNDKTLINELKLIRENFN